MRLVNKATLRPILRTPMRVPEKRTVEPAKSPFDYPVVTKENQHELLRRQIKPLIEIPYDERIKSKESMAKNIIRYLGQELQLIGSPVRLTVDRLPCRVHPIVRTPIVVRNRTDYNVGIGVDGVRPVVGHMVRSPDGRFVCVPPNSLYDERDLFLDVADILQGFVNQPGFPVSINLGDSGGWRRFVVRINDDKEIMLSGVLNPRTMYLENVAQQRENYRDHILNQSRKNGINLKSLYLHPSPVDRGSCDTYPLELLSGEPTISQVINGKTYKISPASYMLDRTNVLESFLVALRQITEKDFGLKKSTNEESKPILIDMDCDIGTTIVSLKGLFSNAIGLSGSQVEADETSFNVENNGVQNCTILPSVKNECLLFSRIMKSKSIGDNDVLVILKLVGQRQRLIREIRDNKNINRVIAFAQGEKAVESLKLLCRRRKNTDDLGPFSLISATPVEIEPDSPNLSIIITLERIIH